MSETISHNALTANSANFQVAGGIYLVNASGTIAVGSYIELQHLVNGGLTSDLNPKIRFVSTDVGGTKQIVLSAGTYRWSLPDHGHNVTTKLSS